MKKQFSGNGNELLNCIIDILIQLDRGLHGEKPRIIDIWDNRGDSQQPKFCPKDEAALSDYIDRYLDEHLARKKIIVNREVEIRKGEKTDIHVVAVNPAVEDQIKVIIEVKGCWNKELKTAMQSQLLETYLNNNQCPFGLYLVGWFSCEQWDDSDYRKKGVPRWTLEKARSFFETQAHELKAKETACGLELRAFVLDTCL